MKTKPRRPVDPVEIFDYTPEDLERQLADMRRHEREEQEQLAEMMTPEYTSEDGLYQGRTFAGARDAFISQHVKDLEGIYKSIQILEGRIEKMKGNNNGR